MKKILSIFIGIALIFSVPTVIFAAEETQKITIEMRDMYGDGWNGFQLKACLVNGDGTEEILEQGITVPDDTAKALYSVTVAKDAEVRIYCENVGSYPEECAFTVKREGIVQYMCNNGEALSNDQLVFTSTAISSDQARGASVAYNVAPSYTVTLPTTVNLGETVIITAENVVLPHGKQIEVSLCETNSFQVESDEGAQLTYTVTNGESNIAEGETILTVNPLRANSGSASLSFTAPTEYTYSGDYTGTIVFNVAVQESTIKLISFYIGDEEYIAEENMTWADWMNSSYNNDTNDNQFQAFEVWEDFVCIYDQSGERAVFDKDSNLCVPEDTIIADYEYDLFLMYN